MADIEIVPYYGTRTPADFDMLFDELEAARGTSASLSDAIGEKADAAASQAVQDAALVEQIDEGAKNKLHYDEISAPSGDTANISFSCSGDTITIAGSTSSSAAWCYLKLNGSSLIVNDFCNGKYFLSSERTGSGAADVFAYESGVGQFADDSGNGAVIPNKSTSNAVRIMVNIPKYATVNITLKIMVCTVADYAISPAYVPYRPSWQEMYEMILALQTGTRSMPVLAKSAEPEVEPETGEEEETR